MSSTPTGLDHPTRTALLEAAEPLFAAHGYSGVALRSIAAAAGVHLGVIPYHFGSKAQLYREIWQCWMGAAANADVLAAIETNVGLSPSQRLRELVGAFFHGPRQLLREPRGRYFVAIMVREAHDPRNAERGLLDEFVYPSGNAVREALRRQFPSMPTDAFDIAFQMMVSGLRVVFESGGFAGERIPEQPQADKLFDLLVDFVSNGWSRIGIPETTKSGE